MKISQEIGQKFFFLGEKYFQKGQETGRVEWKWPAVVKMAGGGTFPQDEEKRPAVVKMFGGVELPGGGGLPAGRVELRGGSAIEEPSSQIGGFFYEFATSSS